MRPSLASAAAVSALLLAACGDRDASTAKDLTSFAFLAARNPALAADVAATLSGTDVAALVPEGTNLGALRPSFEFTGLEVTVDGEPQQSGANFHDFSQPVTYTVMAEDGSTTRYTVTLSTTPRTTRELGSFVFRTTDNPGLRDDVACTIAGTAISATVPFGTDVTALKATFTTNGAAVKVGAVVQESRVTPNNFADPVVYTVVAGDGSTQSYTVTVKVAASDAKALTSFSFLAAYNPSLPGNVAGLIGGSTISVTVPFGTALGALVANFRTTGASVKVLGVEQSVGVTPNDFSKPVVYTVTAADGSSTTYTVVVLVAANTAKELTGFGFDKAANPALAADVTAGISGTAIAATVQFGTDVRALKATFVTTGDRVKVGSVVQQSGATANDFSAPVTYTVVAADGTTRDFVVTVTVAKNPAKELTAYGFYLADNTGNLTGDAPGLVNGTDVAVQVTSVNDLTKIVARFTTTGASVRVGSTTQVSGTTANDFTSPVVYTVVAEDGSTKDFTVTVQIAQ